MIVTTITGKNEKYFDSVIGPFWEQRTLNETYLGLIDDNDEAVGAAVLETDNKAMMIKYFGISDDKRGKGYGRYFLKEITDNINRIFVSHISCVIFVEENAEDNGILAFLEHCGFSLREIEGRRSIYELKEVLEAAPFGKGSLPQGVKFIRGAKADEKLRERIFGLAEEADDNGMYLDAEIMLSGENRYGGILIKQDEIRGMLSATPFLDGVRIVGMYAGNKALSEISYLFDYAAEAVRYENPIPEKLYIDTVGDKLMKFEDTLLASKNIKAKKKMKAVIANLEV